MSAQRKVIKFSKTQMPVAQYQLITPAIAASYLKKNACNRRIRPARVKEYIMDMKEGRWNLNHEAIAVNKTGMLLDGQNRMTAIVQSGVSVMMLVVEKLDYGNPLEMACDMGATRNASDLHGLSFKASAALKIIGSMIHSSKKVTKSKIGQYAEAFPLVAKIDESIDSKGTSITSAMIAAATIYAIGYKSKAYVIEKMGRIRWGQFEKFTPIDKATYAFVSKGGFKSGDLNARIELAYKYCTFFDKQCQDHVKLTVNKERSEKALKCLNRQWDKYEQLKGR